MDIKYITPPQREPENHPEPVSCGPRDAESPGSQRKGAADRSWPVGELTVSGAESSGR